MRIVITLLLAADASAASLSIGLKRSSQPMSSDMSKRGVLDLQAKYIIEGGGYYATVGVGTPPQEIEMHLDTGSSDTWVNSIDTEVCDTGIYTGCDDFFDNSKSSSFETVDEDGFEISYLDQRTAKGDYFNDTVIIGGQKIEKQRLGLAKDPIPGGGVMGLGLSGGVSSSEMYPAIVDMMATQGLINRAAFSVYLNHSDAEAGNILFGAIDTEKFIGNLTTLPLLPASLPGREGDYAAYAVKMSGLSTSTSPDSSKAKDLDMTVIPDTGATLSLFPDDVVQPIWDELDLYISDQAAFIECDYAKSNKTDFHIRFAFGDAAIEVPLKEMIIDTGNAELFRLTGVELEKPCVFGIQTFASTNATAGNFGLLGDTFLRSAYVVFDASNHQIGIAQANVGSSKSNIIELKANETSFPQVTGTIERNSQTSTAPSATSTSDGDGNNGGDGSNDDESNNKDGEKDGKGSNDQPKDNAVDKLFLPWVIGLLTTALIATW